MITKPNNLMKKLFLLVAALFVLAPLAVQAQNSEDSNKSAKIEFIADKPEDEKATVAAEYKFGDISQGDKVEHTFKFKNSGDAPLVLTNVSVTCGCTAPYWPREAIQPGEEAEILVRFNSTGKMGLQNKVITIYSNATNNPERIKIVTNVLKPWGNTPQPFNNSWTYLATSSLWEFVAFLWDLRKNTVFRV